ncbi:MAG TPA: NAD(P)/FAD-dependent oxidoreductase [Methanoregula sp.]|nr:NAD(P)/FAD-dependent oxidoreductase [Methanoregula sp.]
MITVLGGGPAGRIASIRLASAGKEVQLIEQGGIGGQCLHFGCMPVCALNDIARMMHSTRTYRDMGIFDSVPRLHFPTLLHEMKGIQRKIASILDNETRSAGVDIVYGRAGRFEKDRIFLDDEEIDAGHVILATGSRPYIPDEKGIDLPGIYTPHSLWDMKELPDTLTIVGCGIMAAEFAYIFKEFGSKVTLICRSAFLKSLDNHLRALARKELQGVEIRENSSICSFNGDPDVASVHVKTNGQDLSLRTDAVLLATGLVPRSEKLNGVVKGPAGEVIVDDRMRTNIENVYAAGDVTGPPYLTPVARHQGLVAADNILGKDRRMDYRYIPQSVNLTNELAFCITSDEGTAKLTIPGPAGPGTFWSVPSGETGLAKIMADPDSGEIRGICSAGPGGGLIAGYMAFLMKRNFSVHDFEEFIEVHPSTDGVYGLAKYTSELLKKHT